MLPEHFNDDEKLYRAVLPLSYFWEEDCNGQLEALGRGKDYSVMLDVGKIYGKETAVRQLKWDSSILDVFNELMKEEE